MPFADKAVQKEYYRKWRATHKDLCHELNRKYRERHHDEIIVKNKEYYQVHKEERYRYRQQYYSKNREKVLQKCQEYRDFHPERMSWQCMLKRCYREENDNYRYYGGRGIIVCDAWRKSFDQFVKDMGPKPKGMTIDRIDPDGNYEPSNCRWATPFDQIHNRRKRL